MPAGRSRFRHDDEGAARPVHAARDSAVRPQRHPKSERNRPHRYRSLVNTSAGCSISRRHGCTLRPRSCLSCSRRAIRGCSVTTGSSESAGCFLAFLCPTRSTCRTHALERRVGREPNVLLRAALHPDGDEDGDHVVHPGRIGAGASKCSRIAVFTRPGSSTFAVTPRPCRVSSPACAPPTLRRSPALGRWRVCPPRG